MWIELAGAGLVLGICCVIWGLQGWRSRQKQVDVSLPEAWKRVSKAEIIRTRGESPARPEAVRPLLRVVVTGRVDSQDADFLG